MLLVIELSQEVRKQEPAHVPTSPDIMLVIAYLNQKRGSS